MSRKPIFDEKMRTWQMTISPSQQKWLLKKSKESDLTVSDLVRRGVDYLRYCPIFEGEKFK